MTQDVRPGRRAMEFLVLLAIAAAVFAFLSHESEDGEDDD